MTLTEAVEVLSVHSHRGSSHWAPVLVCGRAFAVPDQREDMELSEFEAIAVAERYSDLSEQV